MLDLQEVVSEAVEPTHIISHFLRSLLPETLRQLRQFPRKFTQKTNMTHVGELPEKHSESEEYSRSQRVPREFGIPHVVLEKAGNADFQLSLSLIYKPAT